MHPIDFVGTNVELCPPDGKSVENDMNVPAFKGVDKRHQIFYLQAWMPSKEDMDAMNAGRPLMLKIIAAKAPMVMLYTEDENGQPNICE